MVLVLSPQVFESFNKDRYVQPTENVLLKRLEYTDHPVSRFENTVVLQQFDKNTVLNIPAGIGITYSDELSDKLRSRYLYSVKSIKLSTYKLIDSNESGYVYEKKRSN